MKTNWLPWALLGAATMTLTACEDGHNHAEVSFLKPTDGQVIPLSEASEVEIHVRFEYEKEAEEVEVHLYRTDDPNSHIIHWHSHSHQKVVEFKETRDLSSFGTGTVFKLEAKACEDHDCKEFTSKSIQFSLGG